eukprot:5975363-Amphidinium_carterae.1
MNNFGAPAPEEVSGDVMGLAPLVKLEQLILPRTRVRRELGRDGDHVIIVIYVANQTWRVQYHAFCFYLRLICLLTRGTQIWRYPNPSKADHKWNPIL